MTDREKRKLRKQWKEKTRRYRAAKKQIDENQLDENSPPPSPPEVPAVPADIVQQNVIVDKRKENGQKKRRKRREKFKFRIKDLESQLKNMERKPSNYKKMQSRMNVVENKTLDQTPRNLVKQMLRNQKVSPAIKKRLLFCSVMKNKSRKVLFKKQEVQRKSEISPIKWLELFLKSTSFGVH